MPLVSPPRRVALFSFVIIFLNFFLLSSCKSDQPYTFRFIGNGEWTNPRNWKDIYPGPIIPPGDTLIIEDTAVCRISQPGLSITIDGILVVKGNFINNGTITIFGQMLNKSRSRVINGGRLWNSGNITTESGSALTLVSYGKLGNTKGDTINNSGVMALIHGNLLNNGVYLNQAKGSIGIGGNSYTSGSFSNEGALQIDSALHIGGVFQNFGRLWCTNRGVLAIDSGGNLRNIYQEGTIRMKDQTQLTIMPSGILDNEDSLLTDKGASITNNGTLINYDYLYSGGKLINRGNLTLSTALRDSIKTATGARALASVNLFFGDTLLNAVSFNNIGGTVTNTGTGTFISFFQAKLTGYSSGNIYAITSQPSNANCGAPGCQVSFVVVATGTAVTYQWQVSTDNGKSWNNVPASSPYFGSTTSVLELTNPPDSFAGYQYRCVLNGPQTDNQGISGAGTLSLNGKGRK